jgi:hypothetical protein
MTLLQAHIYSYRGQGRMSVVERPGDLNAVRLQSGDVAGTRVTAYVLITAEMCASAWRTGD